MTLVKKLRSLQEFWSDPDRMMFPAWVDDADNGCKLLEQVARDAADIIERYEKLRLSVSQYIGEAEVKLAVFRFLTEPREDES